MRCSLEIHRFSLPLHRPYVLPFGAIEVFQSFVVMLRSCGRIGLGETTPLPGYGWETCDGTEEHLAEMGRQLTGGEPLDALVDSLLEVAPFLASALACAVETWHQDPEQYQRPLARPVPLSGLCGGETPSEAAAAAAALIGQGYSTLKLKASPGDTAGTLARVAAVTTCAAAGTIISVDANQTLAFDEACHLALGLRDLPVAWLEQPLAAADWEGHARLIAETRLPVFLDESVASAADIARARSIGAAGVKLKLCKHLGRSAVAALIRQARELGLEVLLGNGVQTVIGNFAEAHLHADLGLRTASEGNGFLKTSVSPVPSEVILDGACITRFALCVDQSLAVGGKPVLTVPSLMV